MLLPVSAKGLEFTLWTAECGLLICVCAYHDLTKGTHNTPGIHITFSSLSFQTHHSTRGKFCACIVCRPRKGVGTKAIARPDEICRKPIAKLNRGGQFHLTYQVGPYLITNGTVHLITFIGAFIHLSIGGFSFGSYPDGNGSLCSRKHRSLTLAMNCMIVIYRFAVINDQSTNHLLPWLFILRTACMMELEKIWFLSR